MPFKYKLYEVFCWLAILLTAVLLFYTAYVILRDSNWADVPFFSFIFLIFFFGVYFGVPIVGLQFIRALRTKAAITRRIFIFTIIIFIIQIFFQLLIAYESIDTIKKIILIIKNRFHFFSSYYREEDILSEIVAILLGLLTLYLEIFLFPLIKKVKRKSASVYDLIDAIGK